MVVLIVHMKVKPGTEQECIRLMRAMEDETRKEPGCLMYIGHHSTEDPLSFSFYEQYTDKAALETHWASAHFAKYVRDGIDLLVTERQKELFAPVS